MNTAQFPQLRACWIQTHCWPRALHSSRRTPQDAPLAPTSSSGCQPLTSWDSCLHCRHTSLCPSPLRPPPPTPYLPLTSRLGPASVVHHGPPGQTGAACPLDSADYWAHIDPSNAAGPQLILVGGSGSDNGCIRAPSERAPLALRCSGG